VLQVYQCVFFDMHSSQLSAGHSLPFNQRLRPMPRSRGHTSPRALCRHRSSLERSSADVLMIDEGHVQNAVEAACRHLLAIEVHATEHCRVMWLYSFVMLTCLTGHLAGCHVHT
jgi:hypothetical protein